MVQSQVSLLTKESHSLHSEMKKNCYPNDFCQLAAASPRGRANVSGGSADQDHAISSSFQEGTLQGYFLLYRLCRLPVLGLSANNIHLFSTRVTLLTFSYVYLVKYMGFPPPLAAHIISCISCLLLSIKLHPFVSKTISIGLFSFSPALNLIFFYSNFLFMFTNPIILFYISLLLFFCFHSCILTMVFAPFSFLLPLLSLISQEKEAQE